MQALIEKDETLVGPVEASKVLGVSRTSLYRMTRDRTIPHYGYFGNRYKYKVADLLAWREAQRVEAVAP
jgi:excisionase family DNA binding protein